MTAESLDSHKKILGILYLVSAGFTLLVLLFVRAILETVFGFALSDADPDEARVAEFVLTLLSFLPVLVIIVDVIPTAIAAVGLLTRATWAPLISLIVGCFHLLAFPVGTVIGIYSIWIYSEHQKLSTNTTK